MTPVLSHEASVMLQAHRERCAVNAAFIKRQFGSTDSYYRSLRIETIDQPHDPLLIRFYELYAKVFPLQEEREPIEGFASVLAFNRDSAAQASFGPLYEPIIALRDPASNDLVAAANFTVYSYPTTRQDYGIDASCQLHFLLVREDLRGLGLASRLLETVEAMMATRASRECGCSEIRSFMTCEQNNPDRMTAEQIEEDARSALIDPFARMTWWRKRGFRRLDFRYVQPPLSIDHEACTYLDYYARPTNNCSPALDRLPAPVLLEHIRRFFFISVGKLKFDMAANAQWQQIEADLVARIAIPLL